MLCDERSWATVPRAASWASLRFLSTMGLMSVLVESFLPTLESVMLPFTTFAITVPCGWGPRVTNSLRSTVPEVPVVFCPGCPSLIPPGGPPIPAARLDTSCSLSPSWSYR